MKTILLTFIAATTLSGCYLFGQNNLIPLDKELSTVEYPYPVSFFGFHSQNQPMRMAYMDVKPETITERILFFCTARISMERTGKKPSLRSLKGIPCCGSRSGGFW